MRPLLVPGETCGALVESDRSGVLVDGKDFYRAFYDACCKAERTILMAGWQFSSNVKLVRGDDAKCCEYPNTLLELLTTLCEERSDLNVYMLPWDSSPVFAFEREPMQKLKLKLKGHNRIHWKMDNMHPAGASHHQKMFIVDRGIAMLGGMDVCRARWDDREHVGCQPIRDNQAKPYHDVNAYVTGDAVDVLRNWFKRRWEIATHQPLELPDQPRKTIEVRSSFDVAAPRVGLSRTWPAMEKSGLPELRELLRLHQRAIGQAKQLIYIENQYFSSYEIATALECRLRQGGPPLEIVMVLPQKSAGLKERVSIGVYQQEILEDLTKVCKATGHRLGVYYHASPLDNGKEVPVFIHSKVLAVDDRFLLISSANLSNRSMGFDTELGVAWEAPEPTESLRAARIELMAEHCGMTPEEATERYASPKDLVAKLDALANSRERLLRIHNRNCDEKPGWLLRKLIPKRTPLDPANPQQFREGLPEPVAWLDRLIREPAVVLFGDRMPWMRKRGSGSGSG
ncbi:MAG TPA: phospholipase D-like domain-containing protein [Kofleriaceae bacterium]